MDEHFGTVIAVVITSLVTGAFTALITITSLKVHMGWMRKSLDDVHRDLNNVRRTHEKHMFHFHTNGKHHLSDLP
jgi:hypothetical protein